MEKETMPLYKLNLTTHGKVLCLISRGYEVDEANASITIDSVEISTNLPNKGPRLAMEETIRLACNLQKI